MMIRTFDATGLVALPRLSAVELLALARAIVAIARKFTDLPDNIVEAVDDIEALIPALAAAVGAMAKPRGNVRAADRVEDNAVGALVDFLAAWVRLPADRYPQAVSAKTCLDAILRGEGLEFLTYTPIVEHSEVQSRIDQMHDEHLDKKIVKLGGAAFIEHLAAAHEVYGVASGATAPLPEAETPAVRENCDAVIEAVKTYVVRVVASVSRKDPETRTRADTLLQPIQTWTSQRSTPATDATPAVPATPAANTNADAPAAPQRAVG